MNKPFHFALAMFFACVGGAIARSYFMHEEVDWFFELASGVGIAFGACALADWRQRRAEAQNETNEE